MGEINTETLGRSSVWALLFALGASLASAQSIKHSGYWHSSTFGSFGPLTLYAERVGPDYSLSIDAGGALFGIQSPDPAPPIVISGMTEGGGGASFALMDHPIFGDVSGTFSPSGGIDLNYTNIPGARIDSMAITGTLTLLSLDLDYRVEFETATPQADRVEGVDFALGKVSAKAETPPMFQWVYPQPAGDDYLALGVGADGTAVGVGNAVIARSGSAFEMAALPAEVRLRTFVGVVNSGSTWVALDDRGQTYRSDDGRTWTESGMLPGDASYSDVAPGAAGRFVFVGSGGQVGEFELGTKNDPLVATASWVAPDGLSFSRAKRIGASVYVGGEGGRLAVWDGTSATLETVAAAETISDVAMGGGKLVVTTLTAAGGAGTVFARDVDGGAWMDAGLGVEFNTVDFNAGADVFLFAGLNRLYGVFGADLTPPPFVAFGTWGFNRVVASGDGFYLAGQDGGFASVASDGTLVDLRNLPYEWPFYHMTRAADRLLMLSRFGRVLHSVNNGLEFFERRIFSGFTSPSPRTSVTLNDDRVLILCDEATGTAVGVDGVSWATTRDVMNSSGGSVFPKFLDSAISDTGLIVGLERSSFGSGMWISDSQPDTFDLVGTTSVSYRAVLFAAGHFLRFAGDDLRIDRSPDGESWTNVNFDNTGGALTAAYFDDAGGFALAGSASGRIFRSVPDFSNWFEVISPFTDPVVGFCHAGSSNILALSQDGEIALSRGADFQIVENHSGPFLDLHWDEESKSVFALGESGKLMRYQTETVAAPPTVWEAWQLGRFTEPQLADPSISGADADPEGDRNANLVEFLTGSDPLLYEQPFALRPFADVDEIGPYVGFDARVPLGMDEYFRFELETSAGGAWFTWGQLFPHENEGTLRLLYTMDSAAVPAGGLLARLRILPKPELGLPD